VTTRRSPLTAPGTSSSWTAQATSAQSWRNTFAKQPELYAYLRDVTDR
jgi:hypothetical protein